MPDSDFKITEVAIRNVSTEKSFNRGLSYFRSGALFDLTRQENELRAYCEGSDSQPYRVSVSWGSAGMESGSCSCPYDWGGICKHQVALLLTWSHKPAEFRAMAATDTLLADRNKEELIILIKEMLKREPDLARLLELPVQPSRQTPLDLDGYRRQIDYALETERDYDYGYHHAGSIATELSAFADTAQRFLDGGDWQNAGALYALIMNETISTYGDLYDEDGDVAIVIETCAAGLGRCFAMGLPNQSLRKRWLETLLSAHLADFELGGIDLAPSAGDLVIEQATDEEWAWIEIRVREAINVASKRSYGDWAQAGLVGFLAARKQHRGQAEVVDDLIFEMGTAEQRAFLLAERGQFEAAIQVAQKNFVDLPGLVISFADALLAAQASDQAVAYITSQLETHSRSSCIIWLAERAQKANDSAESLKWRRLSFTQTPSLQTYQKLQVISQQLGSWDPVRQEILAEIETNENWILRIDIALAEAEVAYALTLLPKITSWHGNNYKMRVAKAAEKDLPEKAIPIYQNYAEKLIAARGRDNYREAAIYLQRVAQLYTNMDESETWKAYVSQLRNKNQNLRAMQDEFNKAKL